MGIMEIGIALAILALGYFLVIKKRNTDPVIVPDPSLPSDQTIPWVSSYTPTMSMVGETGIKYLPNGTISTVSKMVGGATNVPATWGTPATENWVRCTLSKGSLDIGSTGSWVKLDSDQYWAITLTNDQKQKEAVIILDVAVDSNGTNIVNSLKLSLKATR